MITDGSYTYGEHSIPCKVVKSLCCTPVTNVAQYINYNLKKKNSVDRLDTTVPFSELNFLKHFSIDI